MYLRQQISWRKMKNWNDHLGMTDAFLSTFSWMNHLLYTQNLLYIVHDLLNHYMLYRPQLLAGIPKNIRNVSI